MERSRKPLNGVYLLFGETILGKINPFPSNPILLAKIKI
jgi:hypothetical protein